MPDRPLFDFTSASMSPTQSAMTFSRLGGWVSFSARATTSSIVESAPHSAGLWGAPRGCCNAIYQQPVAARPASGVRRASCIAARALLARREGEIRIDHAADQLGEPDARAPAELAPRLGGVGA